MRTRIYIDGIPSWSPNQPSSARLPGYRGSLVTGGPGVVERGRAHKRISRLVDIPLEKMAPDARESVA